MSDAAEARAYPGASHEVASHEVAARATGLAPFSSRIVAGESARRHTITVVFAPLTTPSAVPS